MQKIKFIDIIQLWEKQRLLFNAIWFLSLLLAYSLPKLSNGGKILNFQFYHIGAILGITFLLNILFTAIWMGFFIVYLFKPTKAYFISQKLKYLIVFSPILILVFNLKE
jgi:hypothetical protein